MRHSLPSTVLLMSILCGPAACGGSTDDGKSDASAASESSSSGSGPQRKASCEAMVDHQLNACPGGSTNRLFDMAECERSRAEKEAIGCAKEQAAFVLCVTDAKIDCAQEEEQIPCEDELNAVGACSALFTQAQGCSRVVSRDDECPEGRGKPYNFLCLGKVPNGCEPTSNDPRFSCCPALAGDGKAYFEDPVLTGDELPPDYSAVDFADRTACLTFQDEQGFGTCAESAGCACEHCAAELRECASIHGCLFNRSCDVRSCDPNADPYFLGYGDGASEHDALLACMTAHGCAEKCASGTSP